MNWIEHLGYWYEIQERQGRYVAFIYDYMQNSAGSCEAESKEAAEDAARDLIEELL